MLIHQAIYGEKRGGHALLAHSKGDSIPYEAILDRTDLQGAMPPGAIWQSYLSGFRFQSNYILMRTHPDPTASRGGMVLSQVLFLPLDAAVQMENLESAAELLLSNAAREVSVGPVELSTEAPGPIEPNLASIPGLEKLLGLFFSSHRRPVVWIGQDGFDQAMFGLWRCLLPEMRRALGFKLAFGPQDAYLADFEAVCTPYSSASRWTGFPTTRDKDVSSQALRSAQRLLNMNASSELRSFAEELGVEIKTIADFELLDQAETYAGSEDGTITETLAGVRLLAKLSPNPRTGKKPKEKLILRLERQLVDASATEIRTMRNLDTQPFGDGYRVWEGVSRWVEFGAVPECSLLDSVVPLLIQAEQSPVSDWSRAVFRGIDAYLRHDKSVVASRLWSWWLAEPASATLLAEKTPNSLEFEDALRSSCPEKVDPLTSEPILLLSRQRSWFKLHATVAIASYGVKAAINLHLAIDQLPSSTAGVQILMAGVNEEERITYALERRDPRLLNIAGRACADKPALLASLDMKNESSREILLVALETNSTILHQFSASKGLLEALVDRLVSGDFINPKLWLLIASAGLGDFSLHPRRSDIWKNVTGEARSALLAATADGLLARFALGSSLDQPIEPVLREMITEPKRINSFLQDLTPSRVDVGIQIFQLFPELSERLFEAWLIRWIANSRDIDAKTSSEFGQLIGARKWANCAERLENEVTRNGRFDLIPAIHGCYQLLGFRQRRRVARIPGFGTFRQHPSPVTGKREPRRAVILAALGVELIAVCEHLMQRREERHPQGTIYEVGEFVADGNSHWDVAALQTGPGNALAAVEVERAISHFHPSYVIFVGVAGGLKDVHLGDVVAATKVYGYETGKAEEEFHPRPEIGQSSYQLVQLAMKVARDNKWQDRIAIGFARRPAAIVAPIAAGEKLVASVSSSVYKLLRNNFGDAVAVEMEGSGFLRASYANAHVGALVVRGISDLIEGKAEADAHGSQSIASAHAAAFAFELIANI